MIYFVTSYLITQNLAESIVHGKPILPVFVLLPTCVANLITWVVFTQKEIIQVNAASIKARNRGRRNEHCKCLRHVCRVLAMHFSRYWNIIDGCIVISIPIIQLISWLYYFEVSIPDSNLIFWLSFVN